jgi:hypothetical protein
MSVFSLKPLQCVGESGKQFPLFSFADDSFILEYLRARFLHLSFILKPSQPGDDIIIVGFRVTNNNGGKASLADSCIAFTRDGNTTTCGVEKKRWEMVSF